MTRDLLPAWLVRLPLLVLGSAFAAICIRFHSLWPFHLPVHEDGSHTLLGSIFYFEHAAGELPVELLLSAAIAGAMLRYATPAAGGRAPCARLGLMALAIDGAIVCGSVVQAGGRATLDWLFQFHTRDTSPLEFGSHWRYHLLSEASLMLLAMGLASVVGGTRGSQRLLGSAWTAFAILSLVFGVTAAPFTDARYLGHQARETVTHALTTVPLGVGICSFLSAAGPQPRAFASGHPLGKWTSLAVWPALVALTVYQAAGAMLGGVREHAQTSDPVRLLGTHFFEHTLSYLVVTSHAAFLYVLGSRHATAGQASEGEIS